MKFFTLLFFISVFTFTALAQEDDCESPTSISFSRGNSWLESKQSLFGLNCMASALNKAATQAFPLTLASGEQVASLDIFERIDCKSSIGCWKSIARGTYKPIKLEGSSDLLVFNRPALVESYGTTVILTFYSIEIDTTWITYDDERIQKFLFSEYDKFDEDIALTLTKYAEGNALYYKLVGTVNPGTHPIEPSSLGEAICYFYNAIGNGLVTEIDKMEHDELKRLRDTKQSYYKRCAMQAILGMEEYAVKNPNGKEGGWSFTREEGAKSYWIDNFGDHLKLYVQMKVPQSKVEQVAAKMKEWVEKNKFKNGESTQLEKSGNDYWLNTVCKLGDKTGDDIFSDYYEKFFDKYCEDFLDEVNDVADDIK